LARIKPDINQTNPLMEFQLRQIAGSNDSYTAVVGKFEYFAVVVVVVVGGVNIFRVL
jgi:hypothetical protein